MKTPHPSYIGAIHTDWKTSHCILCLCVSLWSLCVIMCHFVSLCGRFMSLCTSFVSLWSFCISSQLFDWLPTSDVNSRFKPRPVQCRCITESTWKTVIKDGCFTGCFYAAVLKEAARLSWRWMLTQINGLLLAHSPPGLPFSASWQEVCAHCRSSSWAWRTRSWRRRRTGSRRWQTGPWPSRRTPWAASSWPLCSGWSWSAPWWSLGR